MPDTTHSTRALPTNRMVIKAHNMVRKYAWGMKKRFNVDICVAVHSVYGHLVEREFNEKGGVSIASKFDKVFCKLKLWCEKLANQSGVHAVRFIIVPPDNKRNTLGKESYRYLVAMADASNRRCIRWSSEASENKRDAASKMTTEGGGP